MKRILIIVAATVLALVGFTYFTQSKANASETEEAEDVDLLNIPLSQQQFKTAGIQLGEAETRGLDATLHANGQLVLRSQDKGNVASLMGGVVKSILVKEGQQVSKGQVVATVENTDVVSLEREYYSASRECEFARQEMERQRNLNKNGAGVKKNLQQTIKEYRVAQANLTGIARQLQQMGISPYAVGKGKFTTVFPLKAPISGTVAQITASLGSYVDMQTPLMSIRNNGAVECDLNVFEKDINKVKVGDPVLVSLTNHPGTVVRGSVYGMNQYFNDGTKAVAVHVKLQNNGKHLFDGQYVDGQIAVGHQKGYVLPSSAIVKSDGKSYIFALNKRGANGNYSFSRHDVETGVSGNGYTAVKLCKHIRKGQEIVTKNAFYLASMVGDHGED